MDCYARAAAAAAPPRKTTTPMAESRTAVATGAAASADAAPPSLWRELGEALRGTDADYTKIPLRRAVLLLAVPMVL